MFLCVPHLPPHLERGAVQYEILWELTTRHFANKTPALRILGMSRGVKITCFEVPGVSLGGSGVSIGGVRILRVGNQKW